MGDERYYADNLANWNDRVPIHAGPDGYGIDRYVTDADHLSSIVEFDRRYLPDVAGKSLLHLQCHIGSDTVSWGRLGAHVVGVDFSEPALVVADQLARDMGLQARWILSDVYRSPDVLDEQFDIVYTGVGAICWLPDIRRWAEVVAGFTKPGGTFLMREGHPSMWSLDWERNGARLQIELPYFERPHPESFEEDTTYLGTGTMSNTTIHSWNHGLGEIISSLLAVGFRLDVFEEHRFLEWSALPQMYEEGGVWVLPEEQRDLLPLMYTIKATKVDGQ
ncbi:MAG: class I SAM-dependent methyltransferase [Acidimicrobiia bacterium]|nr:class I SAM-dependent methyltransferase [Acidimicrobiia bacterium]